MIKISTISIAGGALVLAAGAGLYMQTSAAAPAVEISELTPVAEVAVSVLDALPADAEGPADLSQDRVELASITLMSSDATDLPKIMTADADFPITPILAAASSDDLMVDRVTETPSVVQDCPVDMVGETRAAAMVSVVLTAPCQPNARVVFQHSGLKFSTTTDEAGRVEVEIPALSENALFLAMMDDGNGAGVEMAVDTLAFYDRSVVQWHGESGLAIHALEYGATYDSAGHVWSGAPRDPGVAARGEGGFVTRLGDTGVDGADMADVYTFPTGTAKSQGDVAVSVEVAVTDLNCGREVAADVIEVSEGIASEMGRLDVTVPDCDAVGDYLLLKNLVSDLKIAAR